MQGGLGTFCERGWYAFRFEEGPRRRAFVRALLPGRPAGALDHWSNRLLSFFLVHTEWGAPVMNADSPAVLEKVQKDRQRGQYRRALERLDEAIGKNPLAFAYYKEAMDVALEAGESRLACQYLRTAQKKMPDKLEALLELSRGFVRTYSDPTLAQSLLESAVRARRLDDAESVLAELKDHTAAELAKRFLVRKQAAVGLGGEALRNELVAGTLSEALLYLRTKLLTEAAPLFIRVLDENPREHEFLGPFLAKLDKRHPNKGEIAYALGCAYLAARQWQKGVERVVVGAVSAPALGADCIARLQALRNEPGTPGEEIDLGLGRLYLAAGDLRAAAARIRSILDAKPFRAPALLDLVKPFVGQGHEDPTLDYLFADIALAAEKSEVVVGHFRRMVKLPRRRSELLAYLENKSRELPLPSDLLLFYGETCLEEGLTGRAIEIFRDLVSQSPGEAPAVEGRLASFASDPEVRRFLSETSRSRPPDNEGAFEIQHYRQRAFDPAASRPQASPQRPRATAASRAPEPEPEARRVPAQEPPRAASREAAPPPAADPRAHASRLDSGIELERDRLFGDGRAQPAGPPRLFKSVAPAPPPARPATPERAAGERSAPEPEISFSSAYTDVVLDGAEGAATAAEPAPPGPPPEEEVTARNLESLCERFRCGHLGADRVLRVIEVAATLGRWGDVKDLLEFQPRNVGEEVARKRYLAEYYTAKGDALTALIILRTIHLNTLGKEARRRVLLLLAESYKSLNRFEAAHGIYLKLMSENSDFEEIERMARKNYERYLQDLSSDTPVLEKITAL